MKNERIARYYNNLFLKDSTAYKKEPLPLVVALADYLKSGRVLDIGAAQGNNSIFLASKGFDVLAWDISKEAVKLLRQNASNISGTLDAQLQDVAEADIPGEFEAIICTFMLHHLAQDDAVSVIEKMQKSTKKGGFNIITAFAKEGDLFKAEPVEGRFYLENKEQLTGLYKGWNIRTCFEKETMVRMRDADGNPAKNVVVILLAQKQ